MGLFQDHPNAVNPELIAWKTNEAALLPIYLGAVVLMLMWTFTSMTQGNSNATSVSIAFAIYAGWRAFRAYEQHRDLRKLQKLYDMRLL